MTFVFPVTRVTKQDDINEIRRLLNSLSPEMRRIIEPQLLALARSATADQILADMRVGRFSDALNAVDFTTLGGTLGQELTPALRKALDAGAKSALAEFPGELGLAFQIPDVLATEFATASAAKLVKEINVSTKAAVRETITRTFTDGLGMSDAAKEIQSVVGLTRKQAQAVQNFRRGLEQVAAGDASLASLRSRYALSRDVLRGKVRPGNIDALTDRYRRRFIRHRAQVIAEHETFTALHAGRQQMWRQLAATGAIDPATDVQEWLVVADDRTCFVETTPVATPAGDVPIKDIRPGDTVLTPVGVRAVEATSERLYGGPMRVLQAKRYLIAATVDHPIFTEGTWREAQSLQVGDSVQPLDNHAVGVSGTLDIGFAQTDHGPAALCQVSITPGVAFRYALVPVGAVHFDVYALGGQGEVERPPPELVFLDVGQAQPIQRMTYEPLRSSLALERTVAGEQTELPISIGGDLTEPLTAGTASDVDGRAAAGFRTVPVVGLLGDESRTAPLTVAVNGTGTATGQRADGVTICDACGHRVLPLADGTGARDRLGLTVSTIAGLRTEAPSASAYGMGRPELNTTRLADERLRTDASGGVVAGTRAELVAGPDTLGSREALATLATLVRERHISNVLASVLRGQPFNVYNLRVQGMPVYYADGLLVHNCEICLPNHGVKRPLGQPFPSGDTAPPAHIGCRCDIRIVTPEVGGGPTA
jgi:hypothetical protein